MTQKSEQSLSNEDMVTIKVEYETVKEFQSVSGNNLIKSYGHFYRNPADSAFIFQNYVLDVYK